MRRLSMRAAAVGAAAFLIVGGGAFAFASASGGKITVCVKHNGGTLYKAHKCAKRDKKLSWNKQGPRGAIGAPGLQGPQGLQGSQGPAGTARAFAEVNAGGASKTPTFTPGRIQGFTAVSNPATGVYCLTPAPGIDPASSAAVTSPLYNSGLAGAEFAYRWEETGSPCSSGQFGVVTAASSGMSSNSVGFTIIVP